MTRMVHCIKLNKETEGLDRAPYPGELGQRILDNVSKEAWQGWLRHQPILINEHRLSPINPEHRSFLEKAMNDYFFGDGGELPAEFSPN